MQWVQMPLISITGDLGTKPTFCAAEVSVAVTRGDDASPTTPHRSQMRKTTRSAAA